MTYEHSRDIYIFLICSAGREGACRSCWAWWTTRTGRTSRGCRTFWTSGRGWRQGAQLWPIKVLTGLISTCLLKLCSLYRERRVEQVRKAAKETKEKVWVWKVQSYYHKLHWPSRGGIGIVQFLPLPSGTSWTRWNSGPCGPARTSGMLQQIRMKNRKSSYCRRNL